MDVVAPSLGSRLRGARLGFGWLSGVMLYLRISEYAGAASIDDPRAMDDLHLFEVCPADAIPTSAAKALYRAWWHKRGSDDPPSMAPELDAFVRRILAPHSTGPLRLREPVAFVIEDSGTFVRWAKVR